MANNFVVDAADADVIFKSSDHVLFYIHRTKLEAHAGAFPPAEFKTNGEAVTLTEDSSTLEHLFHYMYPQRHPNIDLIPVEEFFKLAEAAEKYEVFTLMSLCNMRVRQILTQYPAEAFSYASRHDYPDVLDLTAPLLLDTPLDEIVTKLSPHLVIPWVRYWKCWGRAAEKIIITKFQAKGTIKSKRRECSTCGNSMNLQVGPSYPVVISMDQPLSRKSLQDLDDIPELDEALDAVPHFSTFI